MTVEAVPESILDKIKKLQLHADSAKNIGSHEEAAAFAAKVAELLLKYNLDMADIKLADSSTIEEDISKGLFNPADHGIKQRKTRVEWQEMLASSVARAHFCRILVGRGMNTMAMVGRPHNREVASWLLGVLIRDLEFSADKAYVKFFYECKADGDVTKARGYRASWLSGAVSAIRGRLDAWRADLPEESTALVRSIDVELDAWVDEHSTGTIQTHATTVTNRQGILDGIEHGKSVNIDQRAVRPSSRSSGYSLSIGRSPEVLARDDELTKLYTPMFEKLDIPNVDRNVGVAYNPKMKGFSVVKAVDSATERFDVKPDGFTFYNGLLYLSSSKVNLANRWTLLQSTSFMDVEGVS